MKRAKSKILTALLAVTMAFSLTACGVTQGNVDETVNTAIAPISEQITAINTSIDDLETVDTALGGYIDALETKVTELETSDTATATEITAIKDDVKTLKAKDTELDGKITTLENYVNTELSATEDWAKATFATLTQYAEIQTDITGIKTTLNTVVDTTELATAIAASEDNMKKWVNETLADGYYTITEIDTKLSDLKTELNGKDEELNAAINAQKTALENAKTDLTTAYNEAISTAINDNNGVINQTIADDIAAAKTELQGKIDTINGEITQIKADISTLNSTVAALQDKITELEIRINCLEGKHVVDETQENSITYTWSETAPTSIRKAVCVHCEKEFEEDYAANKWVVGDKVTYVAKDGNSYVSTVGEVTDTKAVLVSDEGFSSYTTITNAEGALSLLSSVGARFPSVDEKVYTDIITPYLMNTLSAASNSTLSLHNGGFLKKNQNQTGAQYISAYYEYYKYSSTYHYLYIWDVEFATAE